VGLVWFAVALFFAIRSGWGLWKWVGGIGTGAAVAAGWWTTYLISVQSFGAAKLQGLTFSGPSAEWLIRALSSPTPPIGFDFGLLPGVFAGFFMGALAGREFQLKGFKDGHSMRRYIAGAIVMGFGSMLASGCAVSAGVRGGSVFAPTAWMALIGMWAGAGLTDRLTDSRSTADRSAVRVSAMSGNMQAPSVRTGRCGEGLRCKVREGKHPV
jgi:hypothetical protein